MHEMPDLRICFADLLSAFLIQNLIDVVLRGLLSVVRDAGLLKLLSQPPLTSTFKTLLGGGQASPVFLTPLKTPPPIPSCFKRHSNAGFTPYARLVGDSSDSLNISEAVAYR